MHGVIRYCLYTQIYRKVEHFLSLAWVVWIIVCDAPKGFHEQFGVLLQNVCWWDNMQSSCGSFVWLFFFFFLNCTVSCIFVVYYVILQCTHPVAHSISFEGRFFLCINLNWYLRHSSFGLRAFANVQKNAIRKLFHHIPKS